MAEKNFFVVKLLPNFRQDEGDSVVVDADYVSADNDRSLSFYDKGPKWFPVFKYAVARFARGAWSHYTLETLEVEDDEDDKITFTL